MKSNMRRDSLNGEREMRILIFGASGFLGEKMLDVMKSSSPGFEVFGTCQEKERSGLFNLDITNPVQVRDLVMNLRPDVVINSVAMSSVDECETKQKLAHAINVSGVENIVHACNATKTKLIQISTDYVFNGKKGDYKETDLMSPINYYGKTKSMAEDIVKQYDGSIIARVALLYGHNPITNKSFVHFVKNNLEANKKIVVFTDQYGTPTLIDDVATALIKLIDVDAKGIFHVAGSERISRAEVAKNICNAFGLNEDLLEFAPALHSHQVAKRPQDSSLNIDKLRKLGIQMSDTSLGIQTVKQQMEAQK